MAKIKTKIVRNGVNQNYVSQTSVVIDTSVVRPKKEATYMKDNYGGAF